MHDDAIVKKIDHVLLKTDDARAAFTMLTRDLGLPVAWPPFDYMGCSSAAIALGRVALEVLEPVRESSVVELMRPGTRLVGLAFEPPAIASAVAQLDARGLGHDPANHFVNTDGRHWTSVPLAYWPEAPIRLLVKYPWDQDARWDSLERDLDRCGGALGVRGLDAIDVSLRDPIDGPRRWRSLLAGGGASPDDRWTPAQGPGLHLVPSDRDALSSMTVTVRDLEVASRCLRRLDRLAGEADGEVHLRVAADQEVTIRLREGRVEG